MSTPRNMNPSVAKTRVGVVEQLIVLAQAIRRNGTSAEATEAAELETMLESRAAELNLSIKAKPESKNGKRPSKRENELAALIGAGARPQGKK